MKVPGEISDGERTCHIKVNFPATRDDWEHGNGEGMWVLVGNEVKALYDSDFDGGTFYGTLDNDSWYYPGLSHGTEVPFDMRGECRPVADYDWLAERYGDSEWRRL